MASTAQATDNEGSTTETRFTRAGRRIVYKVNVLQHPAKARACGQGPKCEHLARTPIGTEDKMTDFVRSIPASTDRRPVDPPPIVDLRIFEEDSDGTEKDVTYAYRANFFMFASIEQARPLAHGRVQSKDPNNGPLLTGAPVSGISYLERPEPAGYFIFPDLSVRHEGRYRLAFTLYEEIRDPALDDRPEGSSNPANDPQEQVYGRCVVRSEPFTVYSAKKFPGLSESTTLSRCVAEQGCRVRIRRDVRMRRRETKDTNKSWDYDEDEGIDVRGGRPHPHTHPQQHYSPEDRVNDIKPHEGHGQPFIPPGAAESSSRARSGSTVSASTYNPALQRTSGMDLNPKYQQSYPPPQMPLQQPQNPYPPPQTLHAYDQPANVPPYGQHQYMPPGHAIAQSPQQMHNYQTTLPPPPPPQYGYQSQPYYAYSSSYGYLPPQQQSQQQQQMSSHMYSSQQPPGMRSDSMSYVSSPQDYQAGPSNSHQYSNNMTASSPLGPVEAGPMRPALISSHQEQMPPNGLANGQPALSSTPNKTAAMSNNNQSYPGTSLPPLQTNPISNSSAQPYDHHGVQPTSVTSSQPPHPPLQPLQAPPPPPPSSQQQQQSPHPYPSIPPYDYRPPPSQYNTNQPGSTPVSSKRKYGPTFDTSHINQRLQGGARPDTSSSVSATPTDSYRYTNLPDPQSDDEDGVPEVMVYRRADGTMVQRRWPKLF